MFQNSHRAKVVCGKVVASWCRPLFLCYDLSTGYENCTALISAGCFHFALTSSPCTSPPSALHYRRLSFSNCGFQTSWPIAFWLGSANGRHWEKIGGERKGEIRVLLPLPASGDISGSDGHFTMAPAPSRKALSSAVPDTPGSPTIVPASTVQPQPGPNLLSLSLPAKKQ